MALPYATDQESSDVEQALKINGLSSLAPNLKETAGKVTASDPLIAKSKTPRYYYLDATRIACVMCVAIDHGASQFGTWNAIYTQNWVLQLLFIVSGVSFAMSRQSLSGYVGRLFTYFFLGVMINMTAWTLAGLDWRSNLFGMVFQFWFIAGLISYSLLLYPLKAYLQKAHNSAIREYGADDPDFVFLLPVSQDRAVPSSEAPTEPAAEPSAEAEAGEISEPSRLEAIQESTTYEGLLTALVVLALGLAGVTVFILMLVEPACQAVLTPHIAKIFEWAAPSAGETMTYWDLPSNALQTQAMVRSFCFYAQCSACSVFIVVAFPKLHKRTSLVGWLILANLFLHRVLFQRNKDERGFHGFDLFLLAFAVAHLGLRHRAQAATVFVRYWFVFLIMCALVWIPGTHERLDCQSPKDVSGRLRVQTLDSFFILAWLTAGEYFFDDRIFTQDKMQFLNWWALAVFLFHKGVHIVFAFPTNWAILVGLLPVCYFLQHRQQS